MPVTVKLSKAFYDRLGEQVVNELVELLNLVDATYRSELRELNEQNFARLEQTRFMVGTMVALWTALLIPVVGLWFR